MRHTIEAQLAQYGEFLDDIADTKATDAPPAASDGPGGSHAPAWGRVLLVAAVALPALVAVTLVLQPAPSTTIGAGTGLPVTLVPFNSPDGMEPVRADTVPYDPQYGVVVLGPRVATADARDLVLVEAQPGGGSLVDVGSDVATEVRGIPAILSQGDGVTVLQWSDQDHDIRVNAGANVDEGTIRRVAEGVTTPADGLITAAYVPDGWTTLWDGRNPTLSFDVSTYSFSDGTGTRFDVTTWSGAPDGAELGIRYPLQAKPVAIRGVAGFLDDSGEANPFLWWVERPGVVVLAQHSGGDALSLLAFADLLQEVDTEGWDQFTKSVQPEPDSSVATTTPPDRTDGPSQTAAEAERDGIVPEVAELPFEERVQVLDTAEPVATEQGVWVLSRLGDLAHSRSDACRLGDVTNIEAVPGRDVICTVEYGELLLLNSDRDRIVRAFPLPALPPQALLVTDDAVYCGRAGDGALPDSMLCRVDRRSGEIVVKVFPHETTSAYAPEGPAFVPSTWSIEAQADAGLFSELSFDAGTIVTTGASGSARFDARTLDLLEPLPGS